MFDIALPGESDGTVIYHSAVAPARPLRPASLVLPGLVEPETHVCELCILYKALQNCSKSIYKDYR